MYADKLKEEKKDKATVVKDKNVFTKKKERLKKSKRPNFKKQLEVVNEELETVKDQYLRILAEFDNYKKRRNRDFLNLREGAKVALIEELLPIMDDFDRSFNSSKTKKSYKSFYKGVELIYNKFKDILEKQGIEYIDAVGQPFNPELHDAVMRIEAKDQPSNIVIEEALKGYKFKDKVIRYSKVVVSD